MRSRFTSCAKVRWNVSISLPSPHVPLSHRLNLTKVFSLAPAILLQPTTWQLAVTPIAHVLAACPAIRAPNSNLSQHRQRDPIRGPEMFHPICRHRWPPPRHRPHRLTWSMAQIRLNAQRMHVTPSGRSPLV